MGLLTFIFLAFCAGGVALAIYEWRKGVKLHEDIVLPHRTDDRADPMAKTRKAILRKGDGRFDDADQS